MLRPTQLCRIEGVALDKAHLAADHFVSGAEVAADVDALDIRPRPLANLVCDGDGTGFPVPVFRPFDVDKGKAGVADFIGEFLDRLLYFIVVVKLASLCTDVFEEVFDFEAANIVFNLDGAEVVPFSFLQGKGDEEAAAIAGQLGDDRNDSKVGVPL